MKTRMLAVGLLLSGLAIYFMKDKLWHEASGIMQNREQDLPPASEKNTLASPSVEKNNSRSAQLAASEKPGDIGASIAQMEAELENSNAIERLNMGVVAIKERTEIGEQLKRLVLMRKQYLEQELLDIQNEVAALELNQKKRLQDYGVNP